MAKGAIEQVCNGNMFIGSAKVKRPIAAGYGTSCGQEETPVDAGVH
jgi:hypothetical protein